MQLSKITGSTADTYLEYIQRNLPAGIAMKVTRVRGSVICLETSPLNEIEVAGWVEGVIESVKQA